MILSIDPGKNGGIAIFDGRPRTTRQLASNLVSTHKMPETDEEIAEWLSDTVKGSHDPVTLVIERIPTWMGGNRFAARTVNGADIATLYGNFQFCRGVCLGLGVEVHMLMPHVWQTAVEVTRKGEELSKTQWKNKLKSAAQNIFVDHKVTLYNADALLIAAAGVAKKLI